MVGTGVLATASRVRRLVASSTILMEASLLKLLGASLIPSMLPSALLDMELSLEAVSGNTDAREVYRVGLDLAYVYNSAATPMPTSRINNFTLPNRVTIFRV